MDSSRTRDGRDEKSRKKEVDVAHKFLRDCPHTGTHVDRCTDPWSPTAILLDV